MKIVMNPIRPAMHEGSDDFHVLIRLQSEPQADFKRTPLNLALVIDRSGSMAGSKLEEAKRCVIDLVERMNPLDKVGLVQYDNTIDTVMPLRAVEQARGVLTAMVSCITAGANTNLHAGWLRGSEMLAPKAGGDEACHVILLSDGQANEGVVDTTAICRQVAALAGAGVTMLNHNQN